MSALAAVLVTVSDSLGNPFPPEAFVVIRALEDAADAPPVATAYAGSTSSFTATLQVGETYRATFIGQRCRDAGLAIFTVTDSTAATVVASEYVSPMLSVDGFVAEQFDEWTRGLVGVSREAAFGEVVAQTLAAMLAQVQANVSKAIEDGRLGSSVDSAVDSWAADFFGSSLLRFPNEPNQAYVNRIIAELSPENMRLLAIQTKTRAYLVLQATYGLAQLLALDNAGGLDTFGGLDDAGTVRIIPQVTAFDRRSDPARSALVALQPGQVCILLAYPGLLKYGFFSGTSFLGQDTFLAPPGIQVTPAPNAALNAYVNASVKALGVEIVWASTNTA